MRRSARLPRRILAISAATFIGALGAVALSAAPASAHTSSISSKVECVEGTPNTVRVTWTITNNFENKATLSKVELNEVGAKVGGIRDGVELAKKGDTAVGSQDFTISGNKGPKLTVKVSWVDGATPETLRDTVDWPKGGCAPTQVKEPTVKVESNCDGLKISIKNTSDAPRKFAVNGSNGFKDREKDLAVGGDWVVDVPAANATKVAVKWKLDGGDWETRGNDRYEWVKPDVCFTITPKSTCTSLTVTVENTGAKAIEATLTVGDQSDTQTIQPGASLPSEEIPGVEGLVAKVSINKGEAQEFKWVKPADCGGGGLPVTGANAGLLAGAALVLVSGGGGLFFMARRRRVRFAA